MPLHSMHSDETYKLSQQKIGTSASGSIDNTEKTVSQQPSCISKANNFIIKMLFEQYFLHLYLIQWALFCTQVFLVTPCVQSL